MDAASWTLSDASRLLGQPQHRLIYLCEKGVVRPDLGEATGRGSSRRFSARNLLEFSVALRLREFKIAVDVIASVLRVLRLFEGAVRKELPDFALPGSLRGPGSPDLRVIVSDDQRLFFTLRRRREKPALFGGISLTEIGSGRSSEIGLSRRLESSRPTPFPTSPADFGHPEGSRHARVEISLTGIARDLRLDP